MDIPIAIPQASAKRVLDDLMIAEHQQTLIRWKRNGMPVVDEIVTGPLNVPLEAKTEIDENKKKLMMTKRGRAVKGKAKDDDFARVQKFVNEGKINNNEKFANMTDREKKVQKANEMIKEKEAGLVSVKRLPKKTNVLEVPLDYYLQGKVGGGFKERVVVKKKTKAELIGEGAKQKRLDEEKKRLYKQSVLKVRAEDCHDNFGVGRDHTLPPNEIDNRHRAAALQVKDDGANLKTCTRPSTHSVIGLTYRKEKTAEELDREKRRRADIDPRVVLRERLNAREESKRKSAIAEYQASDPAEKLKLEAKRRRDPVNSGIARAQLNESELLPALPPNPDVQKAYALLEAGHTKDELCDLMSLPSAQYDIMMTELEEQSLEEAEDIQAEKLKRGHITYHISTHTMKAKEGNSRMSRLRRIMPEEPWNRVGANYNNSNV